MQRLQGAPGLAPAVEFLGAVFAGHSASPATAAAASARAVTVFDVVVDALNTGALSGRGANDCLSVLQAHADLLPTAAIPPLVVAVLTVVTADSSDRVVPDTGIEGQALELLPKLLALLPDGATLTEGPDCPAGGCPVPSFALLRCLLFGPVCHDSLACLRRGQRRRLHGRRIQGVRHAAAGENGVAVLHCCGHSIGQSCAGTAAARRTPADAR